MKQNQKAYIFAVITIVLLAGLVTLIGPMVSAAVWQELGYDPLSFLLVAAPALSILGFLLAKMFRQESLTAYFKALTLIAALPIVICFVIGFARVYSLKD